VPPSRKELQEVSSRVYPDLERVPGKQNWVDKTGGLPSYIERIAKHMHYERGRPIGQAIASAVATTKRWCSTGKNWNGGDLKPTTRAKACKAVASWESKKARSKAKTAAKKLKESTEMQEARELLEANTALPCDDNVAKELAGLVRKRLIIAEGMLPALREPKTVGKQGLVKRAVELLEADLTEPVSIGMIGGPAANPRDMKKVADLLEGEVEELRALAESLGEDVKPWEKKNPKGKKGGKKLTPEQKAKAKKRAKKAGRKYPNLVDNMAAAQMQEGAGPWMKEGDSGEQVKEMQRQVEGMGRYIGDAGADGKFGYQTKQGVKAVQRREGLKADGIVGPETKSMLDSKMPPAEMPDAPSETPEKEEAEVPSWDSTSAARRLRAAKKEMQEATDKGAIAGWLDMVAKAAMEQDAGALAGMLKDKTWPTEWDADIDEMLYEGEDDKLEAMRKVIGAIRSAGDRPLDKSFFESLFMDDMDDREEMAEADVEGSGTAEAATDGNTVTAPPGPPNLRESRGGDMNCGTCESFEGGKCVAHNASVSPTQVCDDWKADGEMAEGMKVEVEVKIEKGKKDKGEGYEEGYEQEGKEDCGCDKGDHAYCPNCGMTHGSSSCGCGHEWEGDEKYCPECGSANKPIIAVLEGPEIAEATIDNRLRGAAMSGLRGLASNRSGWTAARKAAIKRLSDGTFAPKGRGRVLYPGDNVDLGGTRGKVDLDGQSITLGNGRKLKLNKAAQAAPQMATPTSPSGADRTSGKVQAPNGAQHNYSVETLNDDGTKRITFSDADGKELGQAVTGPNADIQDYLDEYTQVGLGTSGPEASRPVNPGMATPIRDGMLGKDESAALKRNVAVDKLVKDNEGKSLADQANSATEKPKGMATPSFEVGDTVRVAGMDDSEPNLKIARLEDGDAVLNYGDQEVTRAPVEDLELQDISDQTGIIDDRMATPTRKRTSEMTRSELLDELESYGYDRSQWESTGFSANPNDGFPSPLEERVINERFVRDNPNWQEGMATPTADRAANLAILSGVGEGQKIAVNVNPDTSVNGPDQGGLWELEKTGSGWNVTHNGKLIDTFATEDVLDWAEDEMLRPTDFISADNMATPTRKDVMADIERMAPGDSKTFANGNIRVMRSEDGYSVSRKENSWDDTFDIEDGEGFDASKAAELVSKLAGDPESVDMPEGTYAERVARLESEGMSTSDAQAAAEAEGYMATPTIQPSPTTPEALGDRLAPLDPVANKVDEPNGRFGSVALDDNPGFRAYSDEIMDGSALGDTVPQEELVARIKEIAETGKSSFDPREYDPEGDLGDEGERIRRVLDAFESGPKEGLADVTRTTLGQAEWRYGLSDAIADLKAGNTADLTRSQRGADFSWKQQLLEKVAGEQNINPGAAGVGRWASMATPTFDWDDVGEAPPDQIPAEFPEFDQDGIKTPGVVALADLPDGASATDAQGRRYRKLGAGSVQGSAVIEGPDGDLWQQDSGTMLIRAFGGPAVLTRMASVDSMATPSMMNYRMETLYGPSKSKKRLLAKREAARAKQAQERGSRAGEPEMDEGDIQDMLDYQYRLSMETPTNPPIPELAAEGSPVRSGAGRIRNVGAMNNEKLLRTLKQQQQWNTESQFERMGLGDPDGTRALESEITYRLALDPSDPKALSPADLVAEMAMATPTREAGDRLDISDITGTPGDSATLIAEVSGVDPVRGPLDNAWQVQSDRTGQIFTIGFGTAAKLDTVEEAREMATPGRIQNFVESGDLLRQVEEPDADIADSIEVIDGPRELGDGLSTSVLAVDDQRFSVQTPTAIHDQVLSRLDGEMAGDFDPEGVEFTELAPRPADTMELPLGSKLANVPTTKSYVTGREIVTPLTGDDLTRVEDGVLDGKVVNMPVGPYMNSPTAKMESTWRQQVLQGRNVELPGGTKVLNQDGTVRVSHQGLVGAIHADGLAPEDRARVAVQAANALDAFDRGEFDDGAPARPGIGESASRRIFEAALDGEPDELAEISGLSPDNFVTGPDWMATPTTPNPTPLPGNYNDNNEAIEFQHLPMGSYFADAGGYTYVLHKPAGSDGKWYIAKPVDPEGNIITDDPHPDAGSKKAHGPTRRIFHFRQPPRSLGGMHQDYVEDHDVTGSSQVPDATDAVTQPDAPETVVTGKYGIEAYEAGSPVRSPKGNVRNLKAMSNAKFLGVYDDMQAYATIDPEGFEKVNAEYGRRTSLPLDDPKTLAQPETPTPEPTPEPPAATAPSIPPFESPGLVPIGPATINPKMSPARSPKGNVRNIKAMNNDKLKGLITQMISNAGDGNAWAIVDSESWDKITEVAEDRGIALPGKLTTAEEDKANSVDAPDMPSGGADLPESERGIYNAIKSAVDGDPTPAPSAVDTTPEEPPAETPQPDSPEVTEPDAPQQPSKLGEVGEILGMTGDDVNGGIMKLRERGVDIDVDAESAETIAAVLKATGISSASMATPTMAPAYGDQLGSASDILTPDEIQSIVDGAPGVSIASSIADGNIPSVPRLERLKLLLPEDGTAATAVDKLIGRGSPSMATPTLGGSDYGVGELSRAELLSELGLPADSDLSIDELRKRLRDRREMVDMIGTPEPPDEEALAAGEPYPRTRYE
jgi:hypothetical protein